MITGFEREFNKLELGKIVKTFPVTTVSPENNISITQALFEKSGVETSDYTSVAKTEKTNCYIAKNNKRYSSFMIKKTEKVETYVVDNGFSENKDYGVEVVLNDRSVKLKKDTDITDINSVRYQLRTDKKMVSFIDTFILSDEKSRKKYAIYESKQKYLEEKAKQSAIKTKRQCNEYN